MKRPWGRMGWVWQVGGTEICSRSWSNMGTGIHGMRWYRMLDQDIWSEVRWVHYGPTVGCVWDHQFLPGLGLLPGLLWVPSSPCEFSFASMWKVLKVLWLHITLYLVLQCLPHPHSRSPSPSALVLRNPTLAWTTFLTQLGLHIHNCDRAGSSLR